MDCSLVKYESSSCNNDQLHMELSYYSFQNMDMHIPLHNLCIHIHFQCSVHKSQGNNELEMKSRLDNNFQSDKECIVRHWTNHDSSRKFLRDKDNLNNHKFQQDNNNQIDNFGQQLFHHEDNRFPTDIFHTSKLNFDQVKNFGFLEDIK